MDNRIVVSRIDDLKPVKKSEYSDFAYTKYEAASRDDFSQVYICFYEIEPGKAPSPKHSHCFNTESFYIISGSGTVETGDGKITIKAGDLITFPPGEAGTHKIINTSETENLVYIDFDTSLVPDIIKYPDSGKTGVKQANGNTRYFIDGTDVDYYTGE